MPATMAAAAGAACSAAAGAENSKKPGRLGRPVGVRRWWGRFQPCSQRRHLRVGFGNHKPERVDHLHAEHCADCRRGQLHDRRGHCAGRGCAGRAGQRHRRRRRRPDRRPGHRSRARHADAERQRFVHLHPGRPTTTAPTASPTGPTTALPIGNSATVSLTVTAVNDPPVGGRRQLHDGRGHAADRRARRRAGQRHRRRRRRADRRPGHRPGARHADAQRRRFVHLHARPRTTTAPTASPTRPTTARPTRNTATVSR